MMADVVITGVKITPNPVNAGGQFIISVEVLPKVFAIMDTDGCCLLNDEGYAIERATETDVWALLDADGAFLLDADNNRIEVIN